MNVREIWAIGSGIPALILLLALISAGFLIRHFYYSAFQSRPARHLWWIRFAAVAITLVAIADLTRKQFQVQLPELVIAFDISGSSDLPVDEQSKSKTRIESATQVLSASRIETLSRRYQLSYWTLGSRARKLAEGVESQTLQAARPNANESESRLGDSIAQIVKHQSGRSTAAILMFSDGAVTNGMSLDESGTRAGQQSIPVISVGLGSLRPPPNLSLTNLQVNRRVRVNEPLTVTVDLSAESMSGNTCDLSITDLNTGERIATAALTVSTDDFRKTLNFQVINHTEGARKLAISAVSSAQESHLDDNQVVTQIQVVAGKTRVLIIQDFPGPWFRFLKGTLLRAVDPQTGERAFAVHTFLQQAAVDYPKIDPTALQSFPGNNDLVNYDLIVLGDVAVDSLGRGKGLTVAQCDALENYVRNLSGNLVFVPGTQHIEQISNQTALARLLPFSENGRPGPLTNETMRLEFTLASEGLGATRGNRKAVGSKSPIGFHLFPFDADLEMLLVIAEFWPVPTTTDSVPLPAITLQRIGTGTTVTHFTDELYRLRYRSDIDLFARYWVRLVTELASERLQKQDQLAVIGTDARLYALNETVNVFAEVFDPAMGLQELTIPFRADDRSGWHNQGFNPAAIP